MEERYYLKFLLIHIKVPQSFEHLKTIHGIFHLTFKSICVALRLLEVDRK
uniref:Uncharacterized protein n=1 Tax=Physcomitrium patens TaxID=3218 RepID=A0A2K1J4E7_PHYPA|nr:hypothetical protein PHYPA_022249 [Physcomitrium patens]